MSPIQRPGGRNGAKSPAPKSATSSKRTRHSPSEKPAAENPAPPSAEVVADGLQADFAPLPTNGARRRDGADPYQHDSLRAQEKFDAATSAAERGQEDEAVRQFLTAAKLAETAHEWHLAALAFRHVGDFLVNPKPPCDLPRAIRMYRRAIDAYHRCGMADDARSVSYYVLYLQMARGHELKLPRRRRVELWLYWAVAGFGHRPLRVVGLGVAIVLFFGILFWGLDGVVASGTREPAGPWESIYFSGITFATVGYGDFVPLPHIRALALLEGALGALNMGFFVAVLANRLRR